MAIFISIASYRDPELEPTIEDCLAKARHPEHLTFGVCWQHGPEETAPRRFSDARFRVIDIDWRESRGACWARAEVMKLWRGEDWFLQLDSHHRFVPDWDVKLLAQAEATRSAKPVLTAYPPAYSSTGDPASFDDEPTLIIFDRFTEDGLLSLKPISIPKQDWGGGPVASRFLAAGFLFAPGSFVEDVPYDPDLYFIGEEITLAVRAFTHGYDLFHPSEIIVWHQYTREGLPKHWSDHTRENGIEQCWDKLDFSSRAKARLLLLDAKDGSFGCGAVRSVADYERYAGLSFSHRRAQDYTRTGGYPPNPPCDRGWEGRTHDRRIWIEFDAAQVPAAAREDSQFWYVSIKDAEGREFLRQDADEAEIAGILAGNPSRIGLIRYFELTAEPANWTVRFYTKSAGWLDAEVSGPAEAEIVTRPDDAMPAHVPPPDCLPRASKDLVLSTGKEGFVVTRRGADGAGILINHSAALLLELANGRHSTGEIAETVRTLYGLEHPPKEDILAFFDSARRIGLIEVDTIKSAA